MAISGQFGRVITGGSSLASSIASIAQEFATLRINRIYEAFMNGSEFEGSTMDAQRAISLLNGMMSEYGNNAKIADSIQSMLSNVRQSNRTRTLNKLDADLIAAGPLGDYSNKVKVIEEMLLDPTITPDERTTLQNELTSAIDDVVANALNQFKNKGKIVVNGSTIDFAIETNKDALLGLYDDFIEQHPEMAERLGGMRDIAVSQISVRAASELWLKVKRTDDKTKLEGYNGQLEILKAAYADLQNSPYGLAGSPEALDILESIREIQGYKETAKDNMARDAADKRLADAEKTIYGEFDALEKAMRKNSMIDGLLGSGNLSAMMAGGQNSINRALEIVDKFAYINGGTTIEVGGRKIDFSRAGIYDMSADARSAAKTLNAWASGNEFVPQNWQTAIKGWATSTGDMVRNNPEVKLEDAYDVAFSSMKSALEDASISASQRQKIMQDFGNTLISLSERFTGKVDAGVLKGLSTEADMYRFGKMPGENDWTFGEYSGNYPAFDQGGNRVLITGSNDEVGSLINPTAMGESGSLISAIQKNQVEVDLWNRGQGQYFTDGWSGIRTQVILGEDTSAWQNGAGMTLMSNTNISVGGKEIPSSRKDTYVRVRLMKAGWEDNTSGKGIEQNTAGWITPVVGMDGTTTWVLTKKVGNNEQFISSDVTDRIIDLMGGSPNSLLTPVGTDGNYVIPLSTEIYSVFEGGGVGGNIPRSVIGTGGADLDNALRTAGYTFIDEVAAVQKKGIEDLIVSGDIVVNDNGRIVAVDKSVINDPTIGYGEGGDSDVDITNQIPRGVVSEIVAANNSDLDKRGGGNPDFPGEVPPPTGPGSNPYTRGYTADNNLSYGAASFAPPKKRQEETFTPAQVSKSIIDFRASERAASAPKTSTTSGPTYTGIPSSNASQYLDTFLRNVPVTGAPGTTPRGGTPPPTSRVPIAPPPYRPTPPTSPTPTPPPTRRDPTRPIAS